MTDRLLTVDQAAALVQCAAKTIRRAIEREELRAINIGDPAAKNASWRIDRTDLEAWLEARSTIKRRDSGRAAAIAPVLAASRRHRPRHTKSRGGLLTVDPGMGKH